MGYLYHLKDVVGKFKAKTASAKYMQIRVGLKGRRSLEPNFEPRTVPEILWTDEEWINDCMKFENGTVDDEAIDNFYTTNQWKFLLIGEEKTSMFFHQDGVAGGAFQAQIFGRKKWTLCPHDQSRFLNVYINTFKIDYKKFPRFADAYCGRVVVNHGEILYYPGYWWHHTKQLDTPSAAYTGALVGIEAERSDLGRERRSHRIVYKDLKEKCTK